MRHRSCCCLSGGKQRPAVCFPGKKRVSICILACILLIKEIQ